MLKSLGKTIFSLFEQKDYLSLLALVVFIVLVLGLPFSFGLSAIMTGSLAAIAVVNFKKIIANYKEGFFKAYILHPIVVLLLFATTLYSDFQEGFKLAYRLNGFLIFPIIILSFAHFLKHVYKELLLLLIASITLSSIITLIINFLPAEMIIGFDFRFEYVENSSAFGMYSPFMRRTQFSNYVAISTLLSALLFYFNYYRKLMVIIFSWLIFFTFILGGRDAQLGLFFGLLILFVFIIVPIAYNKFKSSFGKSGARSIIVFLFIFFFLSPFIAYKVIPPFTKRVDQTRWELHTLKTGEYINFEYEHFTTLSRFVSWKNHWAVIKEHPVLGTGIGDFSSTLFEKYENDAFNFPKYYHNFYLFLWGSGGLLVLFVFLIDIAIWLRSLFHQQFKIFMFGAAYMACYLIILIFDSSILAQMDNILYHFIFCLIPIISIAEKEKFLDTL